MYEGLMCQLSHCVTHSLSGEFDTAHAQVYYEDMENGDRLEAYCSLKHCYSLPESGELWICHGYYDDREDLQALQMGLRFLHHTDIQHKELVARCGVWHSRAQVVEGSFQLKTSFSDYKMVVSAEADDIFWSNKQWDPATGQRLQCCTADTRHTARRSCSFTSKFVLA